MSTLIGTSEERWSLARAIDALAESARQAGRPGLVWIAGLLYPSLLLSLDPAFRSPLVVETTPPSHAGHPPEPLSAIEIVKAAPWPMIGLLLLTPCIGVFLLPLFRLVAGLARLGPARAWEAACAGRPAPRLAEVWRAGKGLTLPTFGLVIQLALMMAAAIAVTALPVVGLVHLLAGSEEGPGSLVLVAALVGPVVLLLLAYTLALSVLAQLSLHSLAHNRRGVYSALLHGWRIMRNDGWATARAVIVDVVLFLTMLLLWRVVAGVVEVLPGIGASLESLAWVALTAFAGVARAGYWARAYRALGGLSPDDGVPGLQAG